MNLNYAIVAVDAETESTVLHFVGFERPPSERDFRSMRQELETDEEMGMVGVEFVLTTAPHAYVEYVKNEFTRNGEWIEEHEYVGKQ